MPKKSFTVLLPYCLASVASPSSSSLLVETPILAFLNTINLFIDINFIESYINDLDYKFWNYTFIVLFLSIYVVISLFIPAILFRNKAIHLRNKYGKKRDEVWKEFKGLMFVKDLYKEFQSDQEEIIKKFSS